MLRSISFKIIEIIQAGFVVVRPYANNLTYILLALDIALFGIMIVTGKKSDFMVIVMKFFTLGIMCFLIIKYEYLAIRFQQSIVWIAAKVGGENTMEYFYNPTLVVEFANRDILTPLRNLIDQSTSWTTKLELQIFYGFASIAITLCFIIVAIQLVIAILEFHLILLMGLILLPFNIFEPLQFIGSKVFQSIIGQAIKLAFIVLIIGISLNVFKSVIRFPDKNSFSLEFIFSFVAASGVMALLAWNAPGLASSMLTGSPNFSAAGFIGTASAFATGIRQSVTSLKNRTTNAVGGTAGAAYEGVQRAKLRTHGSENYR